MNDDKWSMLFLPFRTRTEVRNTLASTLASLMMPRNEVPLFPVEIGALATGNDREVMESLGRVKAYCEGMKGADKKSVAASIGRDVLALFSGALDRMKKLPPEPIRAVELAAARQVRRA